MTAMRMAIEATSPRIPKASRGPGRSWAALQLQDGRHRRGVAQPTTGRSLRFRGIPTRWWGKRRVAAVARRVRRALAIYRELLAQAPTPELAAQVGDLLRSSWRRRRRSGAWSEAERLERDGWKDESPQPAALARLLAERNLQPQEALRLARDGARGRDDIFTNDALAWALYRPGAFDQAWEASERARRTGTHDRRILYHAAAIAAARGDATTARAFATRALDGHPEFDLIAAPAAKALLAELR